MSIKLKSSQSVNLPKMTHLLMSIPSTTNAQWGAQSTFDIREKNISLHEIIIKLNISPITGLTGTAQPNFPNYNPSFFFFKRIEILINGKVFDNLFPDEQFLRNQLFERDEKRKYTNIISGDYSNDAQRYALASNTSDYYIPIWSLFKQTHLNLVNTNTDVQIKIYWDSAVNNINVGTGLTGVPVSTINSSLLLIKCTKLSDDTIYSFKQSIRNLPLCNRYSAVITQNFTANAGINSITCLLSAITGPISHIMFVVRDQTNLSGSNYYKFKAIKDYAIFDSASTNIVGGVPINHAVAQLILNKEYVVSSYCTENALTTTNNNANVYIYGFSGAVADIVTTGRALGYYNFQGNEQLTINFNAGAFGVLTSTYSIDVFAYVDSGVNQGYNSIEKITVY